MENSLIAGLVGILLGSIISSAGYFYKNIERNRKGRNTVIFHLLELRYMLLAESRNASAVMKVYMASCRQFMKDKGLGDQFRLPASIESLIYTHIRNAIDISKPKISSGFVDSYENSIRALSETDPVLAFSIRGKEKMRDLIGSQGLYISNFLSDENLAGSANFTEFLSEQLHEANRQAISYILEDIDHDVRLISKKCGLIQGFKVRNVIKRVGLERFAIDENKMKDAMRPFFSSLFDEMEKIIDKKDECSDLPNPPNP